MLRLVLFFSSAAFDDDADGGVRLEAVHFQLVRLRKAGFSEPLADILSLVALQLKHFTVLGMLDHRTVTSEFLFAGTHDFLQIIFGRESLNCSQCFATITLLDSYVHKSVLYAVVCTLGCCESRGGKETGETQRKLAKSIMERRQRHCPMRFWRADTNTRSALRLKQ